MIPGKIGKYELQSVIGQGGMGVVYKGYDGDIDRTVAVKTMHSHLVAEGHGGDLAQRFKQEARAAARCVHANIVTVFDYGVSADIPYIVMEYVEGLDLQSLLRAEQKLPLQQCMRIILQTLAGLEYAHQQGVIHRDIKPANILLLDNGLVKVTDFGVAKLDTSELTQAGDIIGTPSYMPPEAKTGADADARGDLYAVGVVMLRLLSGERPVSGPGGVPDIEKSLAPSELEPDERVQFQRILTKALAVDLEDRFRSARQFSDELDGISDTDASYQSCQEDLAVTVVDTKRRVSQSRVNVLESAAMDTPPSDSSRYLTPQVMNLLNNELAGYLGPLSSRVIKATAAKSNSLEELINKLKEHIPSEDERTAFICGVENRGVRRLSTSADVTSGFNAPTDNQGPTTPVSPIAGRGPALITSESLNVVTAELAVYIGPLANYLVKRYASKTTDLRQLYKLLGSHIDNENERRAFLGKRR